VPELEFSGRDSSNRAVAVGRLTRAPDGDLAGLARHRDAGGRAWRARRGSVRTSARAGSAQAAYGFSGNAVPADSNMTARSAAALDRAGVCVPVVGYPMGWADSSPALGYLGRNPYGGLCMILPRRDRRE